MRLRRIAGADHEIDDRNNGHRHEKAFVKNIERNGLLHEADLLPDSYGGKFHPRAVPELLGSLPVILKALQRGKVTPKKALLHPHKAPKEVKRIFKHVHDKDERYVVGEEEPLRRGRRPRRRRRRHCPRRGARTGEGRLLARLREPRLHPELHGSMAKVAPLLDIELVELDRACCCGAGVIAEHNQELADTLNARTFALAQQGRGRRPDDEHLLDLPGRAERVPGAARREHGVPRPRQRDAGGRGPALREGHHQQALPVADGRGDRARRGRGEGQAAADRPARRPVLRLLHRAPDRPARDRPRAPARHATCTS